MKVLFIMASAGSSGGNCFLVTGGAGFIGSHLCRRLLAEGSTVVAMDNFCDYYLPIVKENNIRDLNTHPKFRLYRADIRNRDTMLKIFADNKIDVVVHLAAMAGVQPSIKDPLLYHDINIMGTAKLLDMCREFKVDKLVFASSSSVYGNRKDVPFSELMNVDYPISPYAATKKAGELMCHTWHHLHGFSIVCLRFFTVYGPGQRPDLAINKFIDAIYQGKTVSMYGDGSSFRDYTYIDDIIDGIVGAVDYVKKHKNSYEIINLGHSKPVTLKNMISVIAEVLGKQAVVIKSEELPGDVWATFADTAKAQSLLEYKPSTPFRDGIKNQVVWYLETKTNYKASL